MKSANFKITQIYILCPAVFIFFAQNAQASCCMYDWNTTNQQYYSCDVASPDKTACIKKSNEEGMQNKGSIHFEADKTCSSSVFGSGPYSCAGSNQALNETAATAQTVVETKWTNPFDNFEVKIPGMERLSDPVPCPDDPTKYCVKWLGEYTVGLYQYALGIIGILAAVVIMIGGVIWLLAGGNSSKIGDAKKWIGGSIGGLVIALASYTILYQINPNLTIFKPLKITKVENKQPKIEGGCSWKTSCAEYEIQSPSDTDCSAEDRPMKDYHDEDGYSKVNDSNYKCCCANLPTNCNDPAWQKIFTSVAIQKNVDKCIIEAAAKIEGSCRQRPARTDNGTDCSVMQIDYSHCGGLTCDQLENDPWKAVGCAADFLYNQCSNVNKRRPKTNLETNDLWIKDIYAAYNGGCDAIANSKDCPGKLKWECPINCAGPGTNANTGNKDGLCDVPRRTSNFLKYYQDCKK